MDADTINKLLFLALGWLLGLLGPVIVDAIKRRRENALGQQAIFVELCDVAHKLALAAHLIYINQGTLNRERLEWLKQHLEGYEGLAALDNILEAIHLQLSWPEEQLKAYSQDRAASNVKRPVLQKYPVPLLDSRVSALWSFETAVQRRLLEIRTQLDLLNDIVDRSRKFYDMTFEKLESHNYDIVNENIDQCHSEYAESATRIVSHISKLKNLL